MTAEKLINENVGLQCSISQVISDLVDARLHKDSHKEAECISRMETLLVGIKQHLQCTEGFLEDSQSQFINNACKWLEEIDFDCDYFRDGEDYFVNETLINDFKKDMEEQL